VSSASTRPSQRSDGLAGVVKRSRLAQLAFFIAAFSAATLVAKAFGAGWGTAATFGQIAFVGAVFVVLMTGERRRA
jgi:hypothetical protein